MKAVIDQILAAALDNLAPILLSAVLAVAALGYRRGMLRLKRLVKDTNTPNDDLAFAAFEKELRKRGLLPEGYDEALAKAKAEAKDNLDRNRDG